MDAIVYFGKERGLTRWSISPIRQEDYLLVKVAADIDRKRWFSRELPRKPQPPEEPVSVGWLGRRRARRAAQREYQSRQEEYEQSVHSLEENIRQMAEEIKKIVLRAAVTGNVGCVYEKSLGFLAGEDTVIGGLWNRFWKEPVFEAYTSFRWMRPLLSAAEGPAFLLMGFSDDVPLLLEHCACRMKELCWYLCPEDWTQDAEGMAEDFYVEYGLALSIRTQEGRHPFRMPDLISQAPVCVLDLTTEGKIFPGRLAPGSVWIDFLSMEEKEERIRRLSSGVVYVSLKKQWRLSRPRGGKRPEFPDFPVFGNRPGYNPRLRLERS